MDQIREKRTILAASRSGRDYNKTLLRYDISLRNDGINKAEITLFDVRDIISTHLNSLSDLSEEDLVQLKSPYLDRLAVFQITYETNKAKGVNSYRMALSKSSIKLN